MGLAFAEAKSDPREIEIHDLEGHWYLLKLSVSEFKTEAAAGPPTAFERLELYETGLDLRELCRQQLRSAEALLTRRSSLEDELWYRSRLQVLKKSLVRAVAEIEAALQLLQPGPIVP